MRAQLEDRFDVICICFFGRCCGIRGGPFRRLFSKDLLDMLLQLGCNVCGHGLVVLLDPRLVLSLVIVREAIVLGT